MLWHTACCAFPVILQDHTRRLCCLSFPIPLQGRGRWGGGRRWALGFHPSQHVSWLFQFSQFHHQYKAAHLPVMILFIPRIILSPASVILLSLSSSAHHSEQQFWTFLPIFPTKLYYLFDNSHLPQHFSPEPLIYLFFFHWIANNWEITWRARVFHVLSSSNHSPAVLPLAVENSIMGFQYA